MSEIKPYVFISYLHEDLSDVRKIANEIQSWGVGVWLDKDNLLPGMLWKDAIRQAIKQGGYFVGCFSDHYYMRPKTFMNEELVIAVEELRKYTINRSWFIPILLSDCEIPDISIGAGRTLRDLQWIPLYKNWDIGISSLFFAVTPNPAAERRIKKRAQTLPKPIEGSFSNSVAIAARELINKTESDINKGERLAAFIEMAAKSLEDSIHHYVSTGRVSHISCGEIKTLLWAVNHVVETTDNHWLQDAVYKAHGIIWRYTDTWAGIAERNDKEPVSTEILEDLTGQLRGISMWVRINL